MRVLLDTNVFVSAAISNGAPHRILQDWLARRAFELIICPQLLAEVAEVLTERPKLRRWISLDDARALLDRLGAEADLVDDPDEIGPTTRDSDDDYLIALAHAHHATYIVSGDLDLLEWEEADPPVLSPADFEAILAGNASERP